MTDLGRLQPFVAVTQTNPFAMPAKGSLRPETVIHWTVPKVRFLIKKRSFERIAAAQNDLFVGYVGFGISKRKKLAGSDFVA